MKLKSILKKTALVLLVVVVFSTILAYLNNRAMPLEKPAALMADLPEANPPEGMSIYQIPTGVNHRTAAFAYRGGSFFDKREFSMSAVLVKHPKGDLLIDTGFGRHIKEHFATMPFYFRMVTDFNPGVAAAEQLSANGYPQDSIKAILITHAHWDHVSGYPILGTSQFGSVRKNWSLYIAATSFVPSLKALKQTNINPMFLPKHPTLVFR